MSLNINCKITATAPVYPSEDPDKVEQSVSNILPGAKITRQDSSIKASSNIIESLDKLRQTIQSRQSQRIYQRHLEKNLDRDTTWLYLNKQAAMVDVLTLCDEPSESPLGPIELVISSRNIDQIIPWLASGDEYG